MCCASEGSAHPQPPLTSASVRPEQKIGSLTMIIHLPRTVEDIAASVWGGSTADDPLQDFDDPLDGLWVVVCLIQQSSK